MGNLVTCPDVRLYQEVCDGRVAAAEQEALLQHLEDCPECARGFAALPEVDTVVEQLRSADTPIDEPGRALVDELVARLSALRPDTAGLEATQQIETAPQLYDFLAPPQRPDELGRLGPYRVLEVLGRGGMGVVFRAEDPQLQRSVALKAMLPALAASAGARQRFLREARSAAAIKNDHVVTIHQVGEDRGIPYLAMELLAGESLEERLRREPKLGVAETVRIGREIVEGLEAAHGRGLIHRDIKPANIWLEGAKGRVKLLDFGLARATGDDDRLTGPGALLGTPAYMAPEQAEGHPLDPRCDLFSLGCVLYRLLAGQAPFRGPTSMSILRAVATEEPAPPAQRAPEVPPALSQLVLQLLAKDPAARPASAHAVAVALAAAEQRPQSVAPTGRNRGGRRLLLAGVLLGLLGLTALLAAPLLLRIDTEQGTIVLETDDDEVQVRVKQGGKQVELLDARSKKTLTLNAGAYELELVGGPNALRLHTRSFELKRGELRVAKVTFEPRAAGRLPVPAFDKAPAAPEASAFSTALVARPASLDGVRRWTLETIGRRGLQYAQAYSPDSRRVALSGEDGAIRIWDTQSGSLVKMLFDFSGTVFDLAWSPDGTLLAGSSYDRVTFWDVEHGRVVKTIQDGSDFGRLAWSPDGKLVAVGWGGAPVRIFNVRTGELVDRLWASPAKNLTRLAWCAKGQVLARCEEFNSSDIHVSVKLWDWSAGRALPELPCRASNIAPAPHGPLVACSGESTWIYDVLTGKLHHTLASGYVGWLPDGKTLVSRQGFWDAATGKLLRPFQSEQLIRTLPKEDVLSHDVVALSPDGRTCLTRANYRRTCLWVVDTGRPLPCFPEQTPRISSTPVAFSPDGGTVAAGQHDVCFWDIVTGRLARTSMARELGTEPELLSWSGNGEELTISYQNGCRVIHATTGKVLSRVAGRGGWLLLSPNGQALLRLSLNRIEFAATPSATPIKIPGQLAAWAPDSKSFVVKDGDKLRFHDAATRAVVREFTEPGVEYLFWPARENLILARRNRIDVLDPQSGTAIHTWKMSTMDLRPIAWLAEAKRLFLLKGGVVEVWDTSSVRQRFGSAITNARLGPDGRTMACMGRTGRLELWDSEKGVPLGFFIPLAKGGYLCVSPDGHYRGSPGVEKEILYVVETDAGQEMLTPAQFEQRHGWKNNPERVAQSLSHARGG